MSEKAQLDFDYDGSLVRKPADNSPNNVLKGWLPIIPGATDFLDGFVESGGELGRIITVRSRVLRGIQTRRELRRHGLDTRFDPGTAIHFMGRNRDGSGNESAKAERVLDHPNRPSGFVDDNPHKVGPEILRRMLRAQVGRYALTLGVAPHDSQAERLEQFFNDAVDLGAEVDSQNGNVTPIRIGPSRLAVVAIDAYTQVGGVQFHEEVMTTHLAA